MTEPTSTAAGAVLGAFGALPLLVLGAQTDALIIGLFAAMLSTAQIGAINSLGRAAAAAFFSSLSAGYGSPLLVPVVADTIQQANGILPTLSAMLRDHWPALLVIAALVAVFVLSRRIKAARVEAAVTGRDLSK
jgi:hypothetical protein